MTRPLRIEYAGAFYHVINRGIAQENIFLNDRDREKFLEYLEAAFERFSLTIHSYCLMDNHYHLLTETSEPNLGRAMQWLNVSYALYFNTKRKRKGHLFQGRYKAYIVDADEYLKSLSRYIHLNPVRAKLVIKPGDYKWSSYNAFTGKAKAPEWLETRYLLAYFHQKRKRALQLHRNFCEEVDVESLNNPAKDAVEGLILGDENFVKLMQGRLLSFKSDEKEVPQLRGLKPRPAVEKVVKEVGRKFGCGIKEIIKKGKKRNDAREVAIYLARLHTGLTGKKIGEFFDQISGARISIIFQKINSKMESEKRFKREIEKLTKRIVNS